MAVRGSLRWQRAHGLPALIALLLAVAFGTAAPAGTDQRAVRDAGARASHAMAPSPAPTATGQTDVRLLPAMRGAQWTSGLGFAARPLSAYQLPAPTGHRAGTGLAGLSPWSADGEVYRGRAPPRAE